MNEELFNINARYEEDSGTPIPVEQRLNDAEVLEQHHYKIVKAFAAAAMDEWLTEDSVKLETTRLKADKEALTNKNGAMNALIGPIVLRTQDGNSFSPGRSRALWQHIPEDNK